MYARLLVLGSPFSVLRSSFFIIFGAGSAALGKGIFAAALLAAGAGCGQGLVAITGRVHVDGKPVENATVRFIPEDDGPRLAFGMTDSAGNFALTTFEKKDGVLPGVYKVVITSPENTLSPPGQLTGNTQDNMRALAEYKKAWEAMKRQPPKPGVLPVIYAEVSTTPLRWNVPADGRIANFDLWTNAPPQAKP